ncbi:7-cyano-7-deazaguanine synthase [candidate division NPL-UPA2 bacterium]|nr:7-cyano-7-deazaguanine synthase [candidate division NPL-UPA2 bacterium]
MTKAIVLLSGGLDSILAVKLISSQGIAVEAVNFSTVFSCASPDINHREIKKTSESLGVPLKIIDISREHLELVRHPHYGYGKNMNPCIDCHIFMLHQAGKYMKKVGASFLATGEVLGERPMSQRRDALKLIEKKSQWEGLVLRPLSAKLLEPTIPEKKGWIKREKLLDIEGRSRKPQIELAAKFGIKDYPSPAGGCLLTDAIFSARLKDLLQHSRAGLNDIHLLKVGRHFRLSSQAKLVVGRNEGENAKLLTLAQAGDLCFQAADFLGPVALSRGKLTEEEIVAASSLTVRYGQGRKEDALKVKYWKLPGKQSQLLTVSPMPEEELQKLRV